MLSPNAGDALSVGRQVESAVTVDGCNLRYAVHGRGEPVLLLHGFPTSAVIWRNVIPFLARFYAVYAPDLLGYGASEKPAQRDVALPAQGRLMVDFMDKLAIPAAALVGHDLGGGIAQWLAVHHPRRVSRLVLLDTVSNSSWPAPVWRRYQSPSIGRRLTTGALREDLSSTLPHMVEKPERLTPAVLEDYVRPWLTAAGLRAFLRNALALDPKYTVALEGQLSKLAVPTLIIWGEGDRFQPLAHARRLQQIIPDAAFYTVPAAGHLVVEDKPLELADQIVQFLHEPRARAAFA